MIIADRKCGLSTIIPGFDEKEEIRRYFDLLEEKDFSAVEIDGRKVDCSLKNNCLLKFSESSTELFMHKINNYIKALVGKTQSASPAEKLRNLNEALSILSEIYPAAGYPESIEGVGLTLLAGRSAGKSSFCRLFSLPFWPDKRYFASNVFRSFNAETTTSPLFLTVSDRLVQDLDLKIYGQSGFCLAPLSEKLKKDLNSADEERFKIAVGVIAWLRTLPVSLLKILLNGDFISRIDLSTSSDLVPVPFTLADFPGFGFSGSEAPEHVKSAMNVYSELRKKGGVEVLLTPCGDELGIADSSENLQGIRFAPSAGFELGKTIVDIFNFFNLEGDARSSSPVFPEETDQVCCVGGLDRISDESMGCKDSCLRSWNDCYSSKNQDAVDAFVFKTWKDVVATLIDNVLKWPDAQLAFLKQDSAVHKMLTFDLENQLSILDQKSETELRKDFPEEFEQGEGIYFCLFRNASKKQREWSKAEFKKRLYSQLTKDYFLEQVVDTVFSSRSIQPNENIYRTLNSEEVVFLLAKSRILKKNAGTVSLGEELQKNIKALKAILLTSTEQKEANNG
jgi:hypothetical protein